MHHSYEGLDRPGGVLRRSGLLTPLRHRDFRLLWGGLTVSLLGDGALPGRPGVAGVRALGRPAALSLVGIAMTVPTIVFLLLGGVV